MIMSKKKDLLKEAIADAKAVRSTAIANAKLALEEAFTPKLQSMLSNKIAEEMDDEMEDTEDDAMDMAMDAEETEESYNETEDMEETESEEEMTETEDDMDETEEIDEMGDMDEDEMELEEIIKELEGEDDEEMTETYDEDEEVKETEDKELEETNDEAEDMEAVNEEGDEEEMDLEEIISALREEDDVEETEDMEANEDELEEAYKVIRFLKSKINEVNLLNSKLLFSNKLFRGNSLSESQKMKVIETFDRANSVREVKLVYTTLAESITNYVPKKKVNESFASKTIGSTKPSKDVIVESNTFATRMQKLAGLK